MQRMGIGLNVAGLISILSACFQHDEVIKMGIKIKVENLLNMLVISHMISVSKNCGCKRYLTFYITIDD